MRTIKSLGALTLFLSAVPLAGCALGPDFLSPDPPKDAAYLPDGSLSAGKEGEGQRINQGADVPGRWWEMFHNKRLDELTRSAVEKSPTLAAAEAALRAAGETAGSTAGALYPQLSATGSASRAQTVNSTSGPTPVVKIYDTVSTGATFSYVLDIFGGNRRSVEAAQAAAEAQAFTVENTYLTLTSSLAAAAVQEASYREQIDAEREIIATLKELLGVLETQIAVGTASNANLLQQRATLAQAEATLPSLQKKLAQQENTIAVLAGEFPGAYKAEPFRLADFQLPRDLPLSLPSVLARQRPDVRAQEALLHQASAKIGVAEAARFPSITLSTSLSTSAADAARLFMSNSTGWGLASSLAAPIFDGGKLAHAEEAARASYDQASATYRSTVLTAFKDVANALRAVEHDNIAFKSYTTAEQTARESLELTRSRFKAGTGAYTDVLSAQQTYQAARINRASSEADRYQDAITLFTALGGGWWNRPENAVGQYETPAGAAPSSGDKK